MGWPCPQLTPPQTPCLNLFGFLPITNSWNTQRIKKYADTPKGCSQLNPNCRKLLQRPPGFKEKKQKQRSAGMGGGEKKENQENKKDLNIQSHVDLMSPD